MSTNMKYINSFRFMCVSYDGGKDLYKLFADGVKVSSGSWAGDNPVAPVR